MASERELGIELPAHAVAAGRPGEPSEAARVVVAFIRHRDAFPDEAARDLQRLLAHDLARRSTARLRLGHLKLLVEMVAARTGTDLWVTSTQYTEERARRREGGENYPDESTLRIAYHGWSGALRAAARFLKQGGSARVKHAETPSRPPTGGYSPDEILSALVRCRRDIGAWPTQWEYDDWAQTRRLLAARDPRLPSLTVFRKKELRKAFGSFDEAVDVARAAANEP